MTFDPWRELGVDRDCDKTTIRKGFRARVKALHPDSGGQNANAADAITRLIQAYEYLIEYKSWYTAEEVRLEPTGFNYRQFLMERDDLKSKAKLVYYDLLRNRDEDALKLYRETDLVHRGFLVQSLEREDALDAVFLLASAFARDRAWWEALDHFVYLAQEESRRPYFRLFYIEIETALRRILSIEVKGLWDVADLLFQIDRVLPYLVDRREICQLWRTRAQILFDAGQREDAQSSLAKALVLRPKDKGLQVLQNIMKNPTTLP